MANLHTVLEILESLTPNELLLLRSEVDARIDISASGRRSFLWEAVVDELKARGIYTPTALPSSLKRLIRAAEISFDRYFASASEKPPTRNQRYKIFRVVVAETVRAVSHTPRPMTAKTICQVLGEAGGGPAAILDNAFPGYGLYLPTLLSNRTKIYEQDSQIG